MRLFILAVLAVGGVTGLLGCGGNTNGSVDGSYMRVVVGSAAYGPVDANLGDVSLGRNLGVGDAAPRAQAAFFNAGAGAKTLSLRPAGSGSVSVSTVLPLASRTFVTAIALGAPGGSGATAPRFLTVTDNKADIPDGDCTLRFVNVSGYSGPVDVYVDLASDPTPLSSKTPDFTGVAPEAVSDRIGLTAASWRFVVTKAGEKSALIDVTKQVVARTYGVLLLADDATGVGYGLTPYGGQF